MNQKANRLKTIPKLVIALFLIIFAVSATYSFAAENLAVANYFQNDGLLSTQWGQRDEFARFSPDNLRLGCWSTAIAQILYYHRLTPAGGNAYTGSKEYSVDENFDAYHFDWNLFVDNVSAGASEASINEVARYAYFTAVVIQKDWDTGGYMLNHADRAAAVAEHYTCDALLYKSSSYSMDELKQIIRTEIDAGRPMMLHLRDAAEESFHAVALDGYQEEKGAFMVHLNMGWEGDEDGWYDFDGPISKYDDPSYRRIMVIRPE